jgi:hypothetical protein
MIGWGLRIGGVVRCRWIDCWHWSGHQLVGARNVGFAAGAGEQPVVADAMSAVWLCRDLPLSSINRAIP